jgi:hypothetical protein
MAILGELKQSLVAKCVELERNDPSVTSFDRKYGKLEWEIPYSCWVAGELHAK